jgi:hypothetical protein
MTSARYDNEDSRTSPLFPLGKAPGRAVYHPLPCGTEISGVYILQTQYCQAYRYDTAALLYCFMLTAERLQLSQLPVVFFGHTVIILTDHAGLNHNAFNLH